MSLKIRNKHAFSPGFMYLKSCFVTESQILIWNPHFSEMLIYDTVKKFDWFKW